MDRENSSLDQGKVKIQKKLAVLKEMREKCAAEKRILTDDESAEANLLLKQIEELKELPFIAAGPDRTPIDTRFEEGYKPAKAYENRSSSDGDLVFQSADGREHRALPVSKKFSSLESNGSDEIGPGSLGKILRAKLLGDPMLLNDAERRAMGEGIGSAGGWFVPSLVSGYVIDLARNATCCMKAGAFSLPMDGPEVTLVKVISDPTSYWLPEHGAITESDGVFAPITLKAVILGTLVRVSQALLEDAPSAGPTIEKMLAASLGLELDRVCLLGSGSTEPRGLFHCDGINEYSMGANGAAPTNYDPFSYASQYILEDNGQPTAVIMAPRTFGTLDRLKAATTNQPLVAPQSYQDLKKFYSNQVPVDQTQGTEDEASCAFVGDFKNIVVGMRKQLTIDVSPHAGTNTFSQVEMLIRCHMRVDVAVLRENHFTKIVGIAE